MTSAGIPSWASSHADSRAPCNQGRVSSHSTLIFLPAARAARITPSAVPKPAVASAPALQWVSTVPASGNNAAPCAPMARQAARSSSQMASASATGSASMNKLFAIRCTAAPRFTAVGRASATVRMRCRSSGALKPSRASSATAKAPAHPIAGAPRTSMSRIARITSSASS